MVGNKVDLSKLPYPEVQETVQYKHTEQSVRLKVKVVRTMLREILQLRRVLAEREDQINQVRIICQRRVNSASPTMEHPGWLPRQHALWARKMRVADAKEFLDILTPVPDDQSRAG